MAQPRQFCTFHLDRCLFGVEVHKVQEVIRDQAMTPVPLAPDVVSGLINLRGQIVTAVDLRRRLGHPPRKDDKRPMNVVLRTEDGAVSLLVDEIGDVVEVDESGREPPPENLRGVGRELITGVIKMERGLLLLLDTDKALAIPTEV
ncbi:MAG: chemotaxis protein CheW [Planctomycetes bacterium]|nr:chemotaxis protein CheW [Planctomycetota bacterium]